jgi:hypothetical protein
MYNRIKGIPYRGKRNLTMLKFKRALMLLISIITAFGTSITAAGETTLTPDIAILSVEAFTVTGDFVVMPREIVVDGRRLSDLLNDYIGRSEINFGTGAGNNLNNFRVKESYFLSVDFRVADILAERQIIVENDVRNVNWLTANDFKERSSWIVVVNNSITELDPEEYRPRAGDVIRIAFSVMGDGTDLGVPLPGDLTPLFPMANRDELLKAVAGHYARSDVEIEFDIIDTASDISATQAQIDAALHALTQDFDDIDPIGYTDSDIISDGNYNDFVDSNNLGSDFINDFDDIFDEIENGNGINAITPPVTTTTNVIRAAEPPSTAAPETRVVPAQTNPQNTIPVRDPAKTGVEIFTLAPLLLIFIALMVIFKRRKNYNK